MKAESPIKIALEQVINLFDFGNKSKTYSYKNDFNKLWLFEDFEKEEQINDVEKIIIVWDGIPQRNSKDTVNTRKYLTPVDWAAAFSLFISRTNPILSYFRIIILDISSEETSTLKAGRTLMPWVQVVKQGMEAFISILFSSEHKNMRDAFAESGPDKPDTSALKSFWASILTRPLDPGDHHAIANLVGPLLLMDQSVMEGDSHVKALRILMQNIELLPHTLDKDAPLLGPGKRWVDWDEFNLDELLEGGEKLNLILVDDMWQSGWGRILCYAVGVKYDENATVQEDGFVNIGTENEKRTIVVKATASADLILNKLRKMIEDGKKDSRFELSFESPNRSLEIMFLDLRLFDGNDLESVRGFFAEVVKLAKNFIIDQQNEHLPWSGFSDDEIENVERWINNKKAKVEDADYILALTFLPRIIALMDMSLPIILFSSTGRRDIAEKLKDYRNIITNFDKPRFAVDIPLDMAKQTMSKLQEALKKALDFCHASSFIKRIMSSQPFEYRNNKECNHFEIYIDESGKPEQRHFVVGGLLVGYENKDDVLSVHNAMQMNGIVWYGEKSILKRSNDDEAIVLNEKILSPLNEILGNRPVVPFMFFRYPLPEVAPDPTNLLHLDAIDNMFLSLLKTSLEVSIFELAPKFARDSQKFSISAFIANRKRYNDNLVKENWQQLYDKFGIQASVLGKRIVCTFQNGRRITTDIEDVSLINKRGEYDETCVERAIDQKTGGPQTDYYQTIKSDSIYTIIAEILAMRQSDIDLDIDKAVGVMLSYNRNQPPYKSFRHMHYLADYVSHFAYRDRETGKISNDVFSSWEQVQKTGLCVIAYRDESLLTVLDASRRLEADDLVGALLQIALSKSDNESIISRIVIGKIRPSLAKLSGGDFQRFSLLFSGSDEFSQSLKKSPLILSSKSKKGMELLQNSVSIHNAILPQQTTVESTPESKLNSSEPLKHIKEVINIIGTENTITGERFICKGETLGKIVIPAKELTKAKSKNIEISKDTQLLAFVQKSAEKGVFYAREIELQK